jgi:hypothetical protein
MEVLTILENMLGYEEAVNDLNSRLLDVNEVRKFLSISVFIKLKPRLVALPQIRSAAQNA